MPIGTEYGTRCAGRIPVVGVVSLAALIVVAIAFVAASRMWRPSGTVHHVDASRTTSGAGDAWASAFATLDEALRRAAPGDEIWIAAGTYRPDASSGSRDAKFVIPDGVQLFGGFAGHETKRSERDPEANPTVLSGELGDPDRFDDNAKHVVAVPRSRGVMLDGLTIERGSSDRFGGGVIVHGAKRFVMRNCVVRDNRAYAGAGVFNRRSDSVFEDCVFEGNKAIVRGGGIYTVESSPVIAKCRFIGNSSFEGGSGVYVVGGDPRFVDDAFLANRAEEAGAGVRNVIGSMTMERCLFEGNEAASGAGYLHDSGLGALRENVFRENIARERGGGMAVTNGFVDLEGCRFLENRVESERGVGGGLVNERGEVSLVNGEFRGNEAAAGAMVHVEAPGAVTLKDCALEPEGTIGPLVGGDGAVAWIDREELDDAASERDPN